MARYKIVVAYDGTDYFGWQEQKDVTTVCGTLKKIFLDVFCMPCQILGASRTDAGVHAQGQVAVVTIPTYIKPSSLLYAWNNALPGSILIKHVVDVDATYNPHNNIIEKTYTYTVFTRKPDPLQARYGWYVKRAMCFDTLQQALQVFVGTHDFRSFCSGKDEEYGSRGTVRTINSIQVFQDTADTYRIVVKGPGFLRHMIRRIVGACIEVSSRDKFTHTDLYGALQQRNPEQILPNSPALGLCLTKIKYMEE